MVTEEGRTGRNSDLPSRLLLASTPALPAKLVATNTTTPPSTPTSSTIEEVVPELVGDIPYAKTCLYIAIEVVSRFSVVRKKWSLSVKEESLCEFLEAQIISLQVELGMLDNTPTFCTECCCDHKLVAGISQCVVDAPVLLTTIQTRSLDIARDASSVAQTELLSVVVNKTSFECKLIATEAKVCGKFICRWRSGYNEKSKKVGMHMERRRSACLVAKNHGGLIQMEPRRSASLVAKNHRDLMKMEKSHRECTRQMGKAHKGSTKLIDPSGEAKNTRTSEVVVGDKQSVELEHSVSLLSRSFNVGRVTYTVSSSFMYLGHTFMYREYEV